jgi:N-acyl-D-aspartate/D-glutamate deacylase
MPKTKFALLACMLPLVAAAADYDVLIRNARVIDGSGNPWYRGDIAVQGGRIAAIGRL